MSAVEQAVEVDGDKLMQFVFRAVDEVGATLNTALAQVTGLPFSSASWIATWVMKRWSAAPCQGFSPGSTYTRSPCGEKRTRCRRRG